MTTAAPPRPGRGGSAEAEPSWRARTGRRLRSAVRPVTHGPPDALGPLLVYVLLLVAVPSTLVVGPLGAAGSPAQVLGMLLLGWWLLGTVSRAAGQPPRGNPVRWVVLVFTLTVLTSYVAGATRPLLDTLEVSSSDRSVLAVAAWLGVALVVCDGLTDRARLDKLLRALAVGVVGVALLGILQFATGFDLAAVLRIPGLQVNRSFGVVFERSAFRRVSGTTLHPIEFGVVLSAVLPLLAHFAVHSADRRARGRWWIATAVVAAALPMSVARSAILGGVLVFLVCVPGMPRAVRLRVVGGSLVGLLVMSVVVPGLLGTLRSLVLNAGSDPSTTGRTDDYAPALAYVAEHPLLGRGIGTFVPSLYRTLDNQYLGTLVEGGLLGLLGLLVLVVGAAACAGAVRSASRVPATRSLALALLAGLVVMGVNLGTFDALGFPMCASVLFVLVGAVGALWRTEHPRHRRDGSGPAPAVLGAVVVLGALVLALRAGVAAPAVQAGGTVLVTAPGPQQATSGYLRLGVADVATSVVRDAVVGLDERARLTAAGVTDRYEVAVGDGSLMPGTDVVRRGTVLRVQVVAATGADAVRERDLVLDAVSRRLTELQAGAGVDPALWLRSTVIDTSSSTVSGRPSRAAAGSAVLLVLGASAGGTALRRRRGAGRPVLLGGHPGPVCHSNG